MSVSVLVRANPHISFLSVSPVAASRCLRSLVEAADRPLLPNLQAVWVTQSRPRWRPEPPRAGAQAAAPHVRAPSSTPSLASVW